MKNKPTIVGIDYSMTSPAICVHIGQKWSFNNCKFYYLSDRKKYLVKDQWFEGYCHSDYICQEERFHILSEFFLSKIPLESIIFIEGYAFGAKGQVFNIGENCGLLKHKLWKNNFKYEILAPSAIKKMATGKGNADKVKMNEAFIKETGVKIDCHFGLEAGQSPISDIVDAYFIAKAGFESL